MSAVPVVFDFLTSACREAATWIATHPRRKRGRWLAAIAVGAGLAVTAALGQSTAAARSTSYFAKNWLVEDGLPHNVVNRIVQDGRGFLWVATAGGLARFDGREFREYPVPMVPADASVNVRDVAVEDASTLLLLPAGGGVVRLRGDTFSLHPVSAAVTGKTLLSLFVERNGTLWLGGTGSSMMRWRDGRLVTLGPEEGYVVRRAGGRQCFAVDGDGRTWLSCGEFLGWYRDGRMIRVPVDTRGSIIIAAASSGGIWVATDEQLLKWEDDRLTVICDRGAWAPGGAIVQYMFEDAAGRLWAGTRRQGLFCLADGKPVPVPTEHYQITAVTGDAESNLWVAMEGGGIDRLRLKTFVLLDASAGIPDDSSTSVCVDAAGAVWCADRRNGVVQVFEGQTRIFNRTAMQTPLYASNVCPDPDDNIWIGSNNGVYVLPADRSAPIRKLEAALQPVRAMFCARAGDMWVSSGIGPVPGYQLGFFHEGAYHALTAADGFVSKHVVAMAEAADGAVWIGTFDGEVLEFRDGRLQLRVSREDAQTGPIHSLHFDASGALWIGSDHGLVRMHGGVLRHFTRSDGLPDDLITRVLEDDRRRLWLCSRRGFFSVALDDLDALAADKIHRAVATTFGKDEGLPGFSAPIGGQPMAWKAADGRLWFVTSRGVIGFDPEASLPRRTPPAVYIDEALLDDRAVPATGPLRVPPGGHRVEFRLVALNYSAPEKVRLRHQLVGFDRDWIETGAERTVSYAQLSPGSYSLRVIAANQDGRWSENAATLELRVAAAWWQTWWARGAAVLAFTGLVGWIARYWSHQRLKARLQRLEREHALEQERSRIARDLHDELGGSVTQIGMLADRLNRHAAESELKGELRQLAWRTRGLAGELESIVWTVSPKNNNWNQLAAFMAQYARRFFRGTPIECSVEGMEGIPAQPLAPEAQHHVLAVVKEALNNVLKHSGATSVKLSPGFEGGVFSVRIRDNGRGFDPSSPSHAERNGLANMRVRAAETGGTLTIESERGKGSEVILRIPEGALPPAARV